MTDTQKTFDSMPSMASVLFRIVKTLFRKGAGARLPEQTFVLKNIAIDRAHLASYQKLCGFEKSSTLPLTYLHVLAFRLQMEMLLDDDCDFPLLGLVHIENEITRLVSLSPGDTYDLHCRFGSIENHRKGKLIVLLLEAFVDGELVWHERSTMLCRMPNPDFDAEGSDGSSGDSPDAAAPLPVGRRPLNYAAQNLKLAADLGRRYAKISGDRNPIHLWKATAKLLGFKRQIAHGMWSKARVCAAIEPQLKADGPARVRAEFKQPIFLPGKVHLYRAEKKGVHRVEVWDTQGSRLHLVARFDKP